ncbi:arsenate reductase ArsC [candidate division WOR-3 bacterium]|nr:arsenate reductase ArsC [candidate division WOR-3 bacterium]
MTRILFACVGNSCRSQMAEAFCRALGRDVECESAGSKPAAAVASNAVAVMKEIGIDISGARTKGFRDVTGHGFDYMVAMGCSVTCPFVPGSKEIRWEIPDPYGKGIDEYRRVRDSIQSHVRGLLESLGMLGPAHRDNHQPLA